MIIIAVRHTSVDIDKGICYGQIDVDISANFETERKEISSKLTTEDYQNVYSSPLIRCRKLAGDLCHDIPVIYDSRLMELNFGAWEGKKWDDIYNSDEGKAWFKDWLNISCPGGESYHQLINRVSEFLKSVSDLNKNILVITHGGVIRAMSAIISTTEYYKAFDMKIDFGDIIKFKIKCTKGLNP